MHRRTYRWTFTVVSIFAVGALVWGITQTLRRIDDPTEGAMPPGISVPERRPFPSEDARPDEPGSHDDEPVEVTPTPFDNPASISDRVVNEAGEPVAGATVNQTRSVSSTSFASPSDVVRVSLRRRSRLPPTVSSGPPREVTVRDSGTRRSLPRVRVRVRARARARETVNVIGQPSAVTVDATVNAAGPLTKKQGIRSVS